MQPVFQVQRPRSFSLSQDLKTGGSGLPSRHVLYGCEGVGKTSLGAAAPSPVFLMTRGETGLLSLIDFGRVPPQTPHFPEAQCWEEVLAAVTALIDQDHTYKTLVIDTLNGAERLCHEHVCRRDFGGKWGRDGFTAFMTGYEVALADWRELLGLLDRLRETKRMGIIALAHSRVASFKNPEGPDYDRIVPDLHSKTWAFTHKWADSVLYLAYETHVVSSSSAKPKASGGSRRKLHTEHSAAFDAKNRHGLPAEIDGGQGAAELWANLSAALKAAKLTTVVQSPANGSQASQDNLQVDGSEGQ